MRLKKNAFVGVVGTNRAASKDGGDEVWRIQGRRERRIKHESTSLKGLKVRFWD